jgi:hypothetical protein
MMGGASATGIAQLALTEQRSAVLLQGVQSGQINADEFRELQMLINRQAEAGGKGVELSGEYPDSTIGKAFADQATTRAIQEDMGEAQAQFDQLYQEYTHGDYHPSTFPEDGVESRQVQQIDSLYEGLKNGSVTGDEARAVLGTQVWASFFLGKAQSDGQLDESERVDVHERLDTAGAMLNTARTGELRLS